MVAMQNFSSPPSDLMNKAPSGRYGDLRLLGLCIGILFLCSMAILLAPKRLSEEAIIVPAGAATTVSVVNDHGEVMPDNGSQRARAEERFSMPAEMADSRQPVVGGTVDPEEQERIFKEMAEQMPPGAVIVF